jgi:hypothetical protein
VIVKAFVGTQEYRVFPLFSGSPTKEAFSSPFYGISFLLPLSLSWHGNKRRTHVGFETVSLPPLFSK